jgi:hypothetical protein
MQKALPLAIISTIFAGCSDMCENEVVTRMTSPEGRLDAVIFQRDCGTTTGFSTQISVIGAGEQLLGIGNTFRADDDHGSASDGSWGGPWAEIKWLSPNRLLVRYAAKSRVFEQHDDVSGVQVTYQMVGS